MKSGSLLFTLVNVLHELVCSNMRALVNIDYQNGDEVFERLNGPDYYLLIQTLNLISCFPISSFRVSVIAEMVK